MSITKNNTNTNKNIIHKGNNKNNNNVNHDNNNNNHNNINHNMTIATTIPSTKTTKTITIQQQQYQNPAKPVLCQAVLSTAAVGQVQKILLSTKLKIFWQLEQRYHLSLFVWNFFAHLQDNFPLSLDEDPFFKEARESFEKVRERMKAETDEFWKK